MFAVTGRILFAVARPVMRLMGPMMNAPRARVLLIHEGEVLLVKSWFGRQHWSLPGGGIERGEAAEAAACRELHEEVGVVVHAADIAHLLTLRVPEIPFDYVVFARRLTGPKPTLRRDPREILDAKWWPVDSLPTPVSPAVMTALAAWQK